MKEVTKEKVQKYTVYQAVDGTVNPSDPDCNYHEDYED